MVTKTPPSGESPRDAEKPGNRESAQSREVELLKVVVSREDQKVTAQWAIHPQIKHDLLPEEYKEVSALMAQVTGIVGSRFSEILTEAEPDQPGSA